MFKKITLALLLTACTAVLTVEASSWGRRSSQKINQSSRENLIVSVTRAVINNDTESYFKLYTPESQRSLIQQYGSHQNALRELGKINANTRRQIVDNLKKMWGEGNIIGFLNAMMDANADKAWDTCPAKLRELFIQDTGSAAAAKQQLASMMPTFKSSLLQGFEKNPAAAYTIVQRNGKYYLSQPGAKANTQPPSTKSKSRGYASRRELVKRFIYTLYTQDMDGVWELLTDSEKQRLTRQYGSAYQARNAIKNQFVSQFNATQLQNLRNAVNNAQQLEQIIDTVLNGDTSWIVKINGRWYIDKL